MEVIKRRQGGDEFESRMIPVPDSVIIKGRDGEKTLPVKVDEQGRLVIAGDINIDVGDVTIGKVEQGPRAEDAEPWDVAISEKRVLIGGTLYRLLGGNTIIGTAAQRPGPASVAAVVGVGACYWAVDTGEVSQTTGTEWRSVGVA